MKQQLAPPALRQLRKIFILALLLVALSAIPTLFWKALPGPVNQTLKVFAQTNFTCWNRVVAEENYYYWPNGCKGDPTMHNCINTTIQLNDNEISGYLQWVNAGSVIPEGCIAPTTSPHVYCSQDADCPDGWSCRAIPWDGCGPTPTPDASGLIRVSECAHTPWCYPPRSPSGTPTINLTPSVTPTPNNWCAGTDGTVCDYNCNFCNASGCTRMRCPDTTGTCINHVCYPPPTPEPTTAGNIYCSVDEDCPTGWSCRATPWEGCPTSSIPSPSGFESYSTCSHTPWCYPPQGSTPTIAPTINSSISGDANGDGLVDGIDYIIWINHYGQSIYGPQNGNFDNLGKVDGIDYMIWLNNYNA